LTATCDSSRKRWLALIVLCLGDLMIVLDTTIVNVALPSIREDLAFTETSLVWVVNAYMLTYGGFLLLGGRLGDLYGQRRLFLLAPRSSPWRRWRAGWRARRACSWLRERSRGWGRRRLGDRALPHHESLHRARRTREGDGHLRLRDGRGRIGRRAARRPADDALSWHWVFLVNIPVGVAVYALTVILLRESRAPAAAARLDVGGAVTVTASLLLAVYAVVNGNEAGWTSAQTLTLLASAAGCSPCSSRSRLVRDPLMPLRLFRLRSVATANVVAFSGPRDVRVVLRLGALPAARARLHPDAGGPRLPSGQPHYGGVFAGLSAKMVMRFGIRVPLAAGLALTAAGLALFALSPVDGSFVLHVLPACRCSASAAAWP